MPQRSGFIHGAGSALNVELGWIPDRVEIINWTDGDKITVGILSPICAFTSGGLATAVGGSKVIKPGDKITGLTTTGTFATIREVIILAGTFDGGDATGWLIFNEEDMTGNFTGENGEINDSGGNDITLTAAEVEQGVDIDDTGSIALATATTTAGIQSYVGDASNGYAKGFTVGSGVSEANKLLHYWAVRNDSGESGDGVKVAGILQKDVLW